MDSFFYSGLKMDPNSEPRAKIPKLDNTKCCKCNKFFRKGNIKKANIFVTKEDVKEFYAKYNYLATVDEIICDKCYATLRAQKSKNQPNPSTSRQTIEVTEQLGEALSQCSVENSDHSEIPSEPASQHVSQCSMEDNDQSEVPSSGPDSQHLFTSSQQSSEPGSDYHYSQDVTSPKKDTVTMIMDRVCITKSQCFICKSTTGLIDVPFQARLQVFIKRRLFIPKRNRCCSDHLIKKRFYDNTILEFRVQSDESEIEIEELKTFLDSLSNKVDERLHDKIGEFSISSERLKVLTGYDWDTILELADMLNKNLRSSHNRNIVQALVIFLFKLRSGNSDQLIAAILELTETVVRDSVKSVLNCFRTKVLPNMFGVDAYSREFLLQQMSEAAKLLFDLTDVLIIIADGTYLRHEKSANNIYQRKSYSGQKKVPLCKPFTICTTNGFVIDLAGPFEGKLNDAEILKRILDDPHGISNKLKKGDVFILDRGFRDVKKYLEQKGYIVFMPALKGKRDQLTTQESNDTRFVTKIRWVVEAVHGWIAQKCKLLHHQFRNQLLPEAATYCKTACFLYNLKGQRFNCNKENLEIIVNRMKALKAVPNSLAEKVQAANYNRKSVPFAEITSEDLLDFPELTLEDLEIFFTGSYQVSQAISYLGEMLDEQGKLPLSYLIEDSGIVRFEVRSRHINSKTYKCYIHYDGDNVGLSAIQGYCCSCANGLRTIGSCSHVAALIFHLSYGRFLSKTIRPAETLTNLFDVDNVCPVIEEDSDED